MQDVKKMIKASTTKKLKTIDKISEKIFLIAAIITSVSVLMIIAFIFMKGVKPFLPNYAYGQQNVFDFLFGNRYRPDQGVYGIGFIIINTLLISFGAIILSTPFSVITALFIAKVAPKKIKATLTSVIELLASIPSVIFGVFAFATITKLVESIANIFNFQTVQGLSMFAAILLLAIMIFPTITILSIGSINAVDKEIIEASLALGATKVQTNYLVVIKEAKNGIFAGIILGVGRAFGEATAVSMVVGNAFIGPTFNLFNPSRTLTSTILIGLKETTGLDYDIRFSIGLVLLVIIILTNLLLNAVNRRLA